MKQEIIDIVAKDSYLEFQEVESNESTLIFRTDKNGDEGGEIHSDDDEDEALTMKIQLDKMDGVSTQVKPKDHFVYLIVSLSEAAAKKETAQEEEKSADTKSPRAEEEESAEEPETPEEEAAPEEKPKAKSKTKGKKKAAMKVVKEEGEENPEEPTPEPEEVDIRYTRELGGIVASFMVNSSVIVSRLNVAKNLVPKGAEVQILEDFYFKGKDGVLSIISTDLSNHIVAKAPYNGASSFGFTVKATEITDILKAYKGYVHISLHEGGLVIEENGDKYQLSIGDEESFPNIPESQSSDVTFKSDALFIEQIHKASKFASTSSARKNLNGVGIDLQKGLVNVVGADGKKVWVYEHETIGLNHDQMHTIPLSSIKFIQSVFNESKVTFFEKDFESYVSFSNATYEIVILLSDTQFIDYKEFFRKVRGSGEPRHISMETKSLLKSCSKMKIVASSSSVCTLNLKDNVIIETKDELQNKQGQSKVRATIDKGNKIRSVKINLNYIDLVASHMNSESISLKIYDKAMPVIFESERINALVQIVKS